MHHTRMKLSDVNCQELYYHSMLNVGETVGRRHASKTREFVHNCSVLMHRVGIVWHTDLLLRDHRVEMDRYDLQLVDLF